MDWFVEFVVILLFLVLKAFFSGSEIAIVNSDKLKLRHQAKQGDRSAKLLLKMFRTPDVILGTTLVGTNLATVDDLDPRRTDLHRPVRRHRRLHLGAHHDAVSADLRRGRTEERISAKGRHPRALRKPGTAVLFLRLLPGYLCLQPGGAIRDPTGGRRVQTPKNLFITREELQVLLDDSEPSDTTGRVDRHSIRRIIRFADTTVGRPGNWNSSHGLADRGIGKSDDTSDAVPVDPAGSVTRFAVVDKLPAVPHG